ncbi:hypothetical protein [Alteromonas sp. C1M14]|uniref:hypothetical protein n=1 Tax=Alteromonas sp. C1M14 TaxID=2841567 RepID=UPI001C091F7F|nr:hypothetical protein [Alteromonas sp. C1M14]MBU2978232.1 hypothetical protein [Alteromonas sp. C1M14]
MIKLTRLCILVIISTLLFSCSKSTKLWHTAKEEGVSTTTGWGVDSALQYVRLDYLLSLIEENRVHSAKAGRGVTLTITNWQSKMVLSLEPVNTVGKKRRIYETMHVIPGTYVITSNLGTAAYTITLTENTSLDYFDLAKKLHADASKGRGRLTLTLSPADAKVVLYGTPQKYHKGVKLPVGTFKVKVSKHGYEDSLLSVTISDNTLTSKTITLKKKESTAGATNGNRDEKGDIISVVGGAKETSETGPAVETGQLVVLPLRDDIAYLVKSVSGEQFEFAPKLQLPIGNYSVTAKRSDDGEVWETKLVRVRKDQSQSVIFDIPVQAYQYKLDTTLSFKSTSFYRQRVVIHLTPKRGNTVTFKDRMGRNGLEIETELLNGVYEAELHARGIRYDLGTIAISKSKSNKFEFVLK